MNALRSFSQCVGASIVLFGWESTCSHLLLGFEKGWGSSWTFRLWSHSLLLYVGLGVISGALATALDLWGGHRIWDSARPWFWAYFWLCLYAATLIAPVMRPELGWLCYGVVIAPVLIGWALNGLVFLGRRLWARVLFGPVCTVAAVLYLGIGLLVNQRALPGSMLIPKHLGLNVVLGLGCLVAAWAVVLIARRLRGPLCPAGTCLLLVAISLLTGTVAATHAKQIRASAFPPRFSGASAEEGAESSVQDELGTSGPVSRGKHPLESARPNLLFIIVDTLRADRLGSYGYLPARTPVMDRLAARALRFDDHTASSPWTYPSIATLFTSMSPSLHGGHPLRAALGQGLTQGRFGLKPLRAGIRTLAQVLQDEGYGTALVGSNPWLVRGLGLERGFQQYLVVLNTHLTYLPLLYGLAQIHWKPLEPPEITAPASQITALALETIQDASQHPLALVVHYMDPHWPYAPPGSVAEQGTPPTRLGRPVQRLSSFYDLEIAYVDQELGRLLEGAEALGWLDGAVVVLTSDHGETFMDHGDWAGFDEKPGGHDPLGRWGLWHGQSQYQELIRVPLMIKAEGLGVGVVQSPTRAVDLMPSILTLLGIPLPDELEGQPFSSDMRPALSEAILSGDEKKAWREGVYKLIWKPTYPSVDQLELYQLSDDPGEHHNLAAAEPARALRMKAALMAYLEGLEQRAERLGMEDVDDKDTSLHEPSAETVEALRSLGYVE